MDELLSDAEVIKEILCLFNSDFDFLDSVTSWLSISICNNNSNNTGNSIELNGKQQRSSYSLVNTDDNDVRKTLSWLQTSSLTSFSPLSATVNEFRLINELKSYNVISRVSSYDTRTFTKMKRTNVPMLNFSGHLTETSKGLNNKISSSSPTLNTQAQNSFLMKKKCYGNNNNIVHTNVDTFFEELVDVNESDSIILIKDNAKRDQPQLYNNSNNNKANGMHNNINGSSNANNGNNLKNVKKLFIHKKLVSPIIETSEEKYRKNVFDDNKNADDVNDEDYDDFENNEKQSYQEINHNQSNINKSDNYNQLINGYHDQSGNNKMQNISNDNINKNNTFTFNNTITIDDKRNRTIKLNKTVASNLLNQTITIESDNDRNYDDVQEIARKQEETLCSNSPIHPIPNPSLFIANHNKSFSTNDVNTLEFNKFLSPIEGNTTMNMANDIPLISTPHLGNKLIARNLPYSMPQTLQLNQQQMQQEQQQQQQQKQDIQTRLPRKQLQQPLRQIQRPQGQIIPTLTNLRSYKNEQETVGRSLPNIPRKLTRMSQIGTQNNALGSMNNTNYTNIDMNSTFNITNTRTIPVSNKPQSSHQVPLPVKVQPTNNNSYTIKHNQNNNNNNNSNNDNNIINNNSNNNKSNINSNNNNNNIKNSRNNRNGGQVNLNRTATFKVTKPVYDNLITSDENSSKQFNSDYRNENLINGVNEKYDNDDDDHLISPHTIIHESSSNNNKNSKTGPFQSVTNIRAISGPKHAEIDTVIPQTITTGAHQQLLQQQQQQQLQQQQLKFSKIPGPKSVRSAIPVSGSRNTVFPASNTKVMPVPPTSSTKVHSLQQQQQQVQMQQKQLLLQGQQHTGQYQRTQRVQQVEDFGEPQECNGKSWRNGCY